MSTQNDLLLTIHSTDGADLEELSNLSLRLRRELIELDVEDVRPVGGGQLPDGAKSLEAIDWGALIVTLTSAAGGVATLLGTLGNWTHRNPGNEIHMTLPNGVSLMVKGELASGSEFNSLIDLVERAVAQGPEPADSPDLALGTINLREKMISFLSLDEIKTLAFDLGIDYERFDHGNKDALVRGLLLRVDKMGKIDTLRAKCAALNRAQQWHD